jgi:hypothetical protein
VLMLGCEYSFAVAQLLGEPAPTPDLLGPCSGLPNEVRILGRTFSLCPRHRIDLQQAIGRRGRGMEHP